MLAAETINTLPFWFVPLTQGIRSALVNVIGEDFLRLPRVLQCSDVSFRCSDEEDRAVIATWKLCLTASGPKISKTYSVEVPINTVSNKVRDRGGCTAFFFL